MFLTALARYRDTHSHNDLQYLYIFDHRENLKHIHTNSHPPVFRSLAHYLRSPPFQFELIVINDKHEVSPYEKTIKKKRGVQN